MSRTVAIPRLNIPSIKVSDGPNGARGGSFWKMTKAITFPNETALAATFSTDRIESVGALLADETKARGAVCLLAPTINIQRSPLGGRAYESYSEDPTLSGELAAACVRGVQARGISVTIKHLIANDQEHERIGEDSIIAPRPLRDIYLRPFQIAQKRAGPWSYMTSYNKLNGIHCSEDKWLLDDLLRKEWGFDGLVMSDWFGVYSVSGSINAGLSLEMPGPSTWRQMDMVKHLIGAHKIDPRTVDARVAELLTWVQKLAKLNPDIVYAPPGTMEITRDSHRDEDAKFLRQLGGEGCVLLKNDGALPIRTGKVAVIGPNAKATVIAAGGSSQVRASWSVTPWAGLKNNAPDGITLAYELGCIGEKFLPLLDEQFTTMDGKPGFDLVFRPIENDEVVMGAENEVHEWWDKSRIHLADFHHPKLGKDYVSELHAKFTPKESGKYAFGAVVTGHGWVYVNDDLVVDLSESIPKGSSFFSNGTIEVRGTYDVEAGKSYNVRFVHDSRPPPSVTGTPLVICGFRIGFRKVVEADAAMEAAVKLAAECDSVVVVAGLNADWESESYDRPDLSLPFREAELIARVAKVNKNTTVVIQAGSATEMPWLDDVNAVVQAWYGGNEAGNAIADVVYGKINPSGRLPLSFPKRKEDIAAHNNFKSARTRVEYGEGIWVGYKHHNSRLVAPMFPFGFGLSYTSWEYTDLQVETTGNDIESCRIKARVKVTNTGEVKGDHSVHFYTSPPPPTATSEVHPEVSLQAFKKVYGVEPGKTVEVEVEMDKCESFRGLWHATKLITDAISYWDTLDDAFRVEPGTWAVEVRPDAATKGLRAEFQAKEWHWRGL